MLPSPSFLQLMFGAVLYPSPAYSPHPISLPIRGCGASGVSDGDVAGQVGSPAPRSRARVRVRAGVVGAGRLGHAGLRTCIAQGGTRLVLSSRSFVQSSS